VSEPQGPQRARQAGDWESLARGATIVSEGETEGAEILRELLVFLLDGSPYAIPVSRVREIVRLRKVTPMPRVPEEVRGVIALRGEVVQIIDLRMRLHLAVSDPTRRTRIIVLHGEGERVAGVLVDEVKEVVRVSESDVRPATGGEGDAVSELFVRGDDFVSVMDLDRALDFRAAQ
jgi:purine-binding chemotaxis protein CheW